MVGKKGMANCQPRVSGPFSRSWSLANERD